MPDTVDAGQLAAGPAFQPHYPAKPALPSIQHPASSITHSKNQLRHSNRTTQQNRHYPASSIEYHSQQKPTPAFPTALPAKPALQAHTYSLRITYYSLLNFAFKKPPTTLRAHFKSDGPDTCFQRFSGGNPFLQKLK
jgi:hypothetical protein